MEFSAFRVIANWGMQYKRTATTPKESRPQVNLRGVLLEIAFGFDLLSGAGDAMAQFDSDNGLSDVDDCGRKAWGLIRRGESRCEHRVHGRGSSKVAQRVTFRNF